MNLNQILDDCDEILIPNDQGHCIPIKLEDLNLPNLIQLNTNVGNPSPTGSLSPTLSSLCDEPNSIFQPEPEPYGNNEGFQNGTDIQYWNESFYQSDFGLPNSTSISETHSIETVNFDDFARSSEQIQEKLINFRELTNFEVNLAQSDYLEANEPEVYQSVQNNLLQAADSVDSMPITTKSSQIDSNDLISIDDQFPSTSNNYTPNRSPLVQLMADITEAENRNQKRKRKRARSNSTFNTGTLRRSSRIKPGSLGKK